MHFPTSLRDSGLHPILSKGSKWESKVDINELMTLVRAAVPLTAENYPRRMDLTGDQALAFDIAHALLHGQKASGLIAGHIERFDHGDTRAFDEREYEQLRVAAIKLLGNAAGLCGLLGLSEPGVISKLESVFQPR